MAKETIRISEWDGFCHSSKQIEIDTDLKLTDFYTNDYGIQFMKHDGKLFMKYGVADTYERVISDYQIEKAFNPDRIAFNEWLERK